MYKPIAVSQTHRYWSITKHAYFIASLSLKKLPRIHVYIQNDKWLFYFPLHIKTKLNGIKTRLWTMQIEDSITITFIIIENNFYLVNIYF